MLVCLTRRTETLNGRLPQMWALWLSGPCRRATYSQSRDESLSLTPLSNDRTQLVCSFQPNLREARVNDARKQNLCKSNSRNWNKYTCTCSQIYKPPPVISLFLSELRRNRLIPAWFIWIWISYTTAQRPGEQLLLNKNLPWAVTHHPASATPSGQSNLSAFCITDTDTAVIPVYEKCVLHISLNLNTTHFIVWHPIQIALQILWK